MAAKPRKPSRSTEERAKGVEADDGWEPAEITFLPDKRQGKRKAGRPPVHDWTWIDDALDWYLSDPSFRKLVPQVDFIMLVRNRYRQKTGKEPPHQETIEARLRNRPK